MNFWKIKMVQIKKPTNLVQVSENVLKFSRSTFKNAHAMKQEQA